MILKRFFHDKTDRRMLSKLNLFANFVNLNVCTSNISQKRIVDGWPASVLQQLTKKTHVDHKQIIVMKLPCKMKNLF